MRDTSGKASTAARTGHPRAAAFAGPRIEIEIKLRKQTPVFGRDVEELYIGMPDRWPRCADALCDTHRKQNFDDAKQSLQHLLLGKVFFYFLFRKRVAFLAEFFGRKGNVPGFERRDCQILARERAQLGHVAFATRSGALRQIFEKSEHLVGRLGHFGDERHARVVRVAEQLRRFGAQRQDARDRLRIVLFRFAEFRGAFCISRIERFAQSAVLGKLHDSEVGRHMQREAVTSHSGFFCTSPRHRECIFGKAAQLVRVTDIERIIIGCVEHVFGKFLRELREFVFDCREARLVRFGQFSAAELEVAQRVFDDALSGRCRVRVRAARSACGRYPVVISA